MANKNQYPDAISYSNSDSELFRSLMAFDKHEVKSDDNKREAKAESDSTEINYTANDSALFERLMDTDAAVEKTKVNKIKTQTKLEKRNSGDYTENDSALFEELMVFDADKVKGKTFKKNNNKQKIKTAKKNIKPAPISYTKSDSDLFEELMNLDNSDKWFKKTMSEARARNIALTETVSYSESDAEIFDRYMVSSGITPGRISRIGKNVDRNKGARKQIVSRQNIITARDVDHIKIVDFDKEREKQKRNRKIGHGKVKVLYFD